MDLLSSQRVAVGEFLLYTIYTKSCSDPVNWYVKCARTQKVRLNGILSSQTTVFNGVPQGSVLGPALFLIFVLDLSPLIKNFISFYGDDTESFSYILYNKDDMHTPESIQNGINTLTAWSEKIQMSFNVKKCHISVTKSQRLTIL